jgi:hypothetical protein
MSQEFYLLDDEEAFQFSTSMDQREAKRMLRKHAPHLFSEKASVCQPPAPVQVSEDEVKAIVAKAMEEAWSDFCVDANAYPPDITNRRGRISFSPHTWADWTGALVYRALESALQAGVPSGLRYMLDKYKPKCCLGIENCDGSHYGPNAPSHSQADCCMIRAMLAAAPAPGEGR